MDESTPVALFGDPQALAPQRVVREDRGGGSFVLRHPEPLQPFARCIGDWLDHWALTTPDALFLAERDGTGGWRKLSYREVRTQVGRIAQGLLDAQLPAARPVVILSDNAIEAALLGLAAMHVGRPFCTVSSAYCRLTQDHGKICAILDMLSPALVYASDARVYGPAVQAWGMKSAVVFGQGAPEVPGARPFSALAEGDESAAVAAAFAAVRPEHHAKYLLTSGSTGQPKVVINTHRMLCANQQMISQVWPFLVRHRLVLLDWLPWSHTFGANHNFNMALAHGGALYIDEGRPAPGLVERTLRNLREVRPNFYFNVPRGFDMLLPFLEQDDACARDVLGNMEGIFYAGAALPQSIWSRLEAVARKVRERPLWFTSAWGATETSPAATEVHWRIERAGCLGLPLPGTELKFVPNGGKLEMRVRGPSVFPGYLHREDLTAAAFDEEGFYRIGDAGRLVDDTDPAQGVSFDGRVAEDFKLTTGTWVSVGTVRPRIVSELAPHVADVVITGHDQAEIGLLVFPTPQAKALPDGELAAHVLQVLRRLKQEGGGSSQCPTRALLQAEPPSADAGEITDKGYINQRAVLARRAADVAALYRDDPRVIRA
jgi:feruloyl-CoA synthase